MAIIQSIRSRAGKLLAIIIGIALFAFILGDFITSGGRIIKGQRMNVVEINGKGIPFPFFEKRIIQLEEITKLQYGVKTLDENTNLEVRKQAWQNLLQENILNREYDKIGLNVSGVELLDMVQGQKPHPIITQLFGNPETGVIDRANLSNFLQKLKDAPAESQEKVYWKYIEDNIFKQRLFEKYNSLISHGLYATTLEAERQQNEMNTSVDFSYVQKPYTAIPESSVSVSKDEVKAYYKEHKQEFKQAEETRSIKYVEFKVTPSKSDISEAEKWINDIRDEYSKVTQDEQFIKSYSDKEYDATNYKEGELPEMLNEFMANAKIGDMYGPYVEDNAYKLAKLSKINYLPDSVRISQIVLPANQKNVRQVQYLADSLKTLAEKGYDFAELAKNNSRDKSGLEGGDIGWIKEGALNKAFSDSCFYTAKGGVKITFSQAGIHVIKVTDQSKPVKKIQVGILAREIRTSDQTDQYYYTLASEFAGKNNTGAKFEASVKNNNPAAVPVFDLKSSDNTVQNLDKSRPLVKWAYDSKVGAVSNVFRFGDSYVIGTLTKIESAGFKPLEELTATIELAIKKQKKGDLIKKEMADAANGATSIDAVAGKLGLSVQTASSIRFTSYTIPGLGQEPKVIATAINTKLHSLSQPVEGENGVYILSVDNQVSSSNPNITLALTKSYIERNLNARVNYQSFEILKDLANVKDYRTRFF
jgi:peptidyl-prolyl cis-trans isomerase D